MITFIISERNDNNIWHTCALIAFLDNRYKQAPLVFYIRAIFVPLFYRFVGEWTDGRQTFAWQKRSRMHASQSCRKWQWSRADISVIRRSMTGLRAHEVALKTRKCFRSRQGSFSRMIPHELARLCEKVKVERSIVPEGFFIFKGQQLMVDNNCDVSSAYVAILCQFHRYVTISRQEYFGGTLQFFNKTSKKSISARSIELCNISNKTQ